MNIYIDFDNTLTNTSAKVVEILNKRMNQNKDYKRLKEYDFSDLYPNLTYWDIEEVFNDKELYENIEVYNNAIDVIKGESARNNIYIVTLGTKENLEIKKTFLKKIGLGKCVEFIGILNTGKNDKSCVDMKDGVFIDDHIDCLLSTNAKTKILFKSFEKAKWSNCDGIEDIYVVRSWDDIKSIIDFLMEEKI